MPVAADSFTDGSDLFSIRPGADSRLPVGRDVRRHYRARQSHFGRKDKSLAAAGFYDGPSEARLIVLGMAAVAIHHILEKMLSPRNALGSHLHLHAARRGYGGLPERQ